MIRRILRSVHLLALSIPATLLLNSCGSAGKDAVGDAEVRHAEAIVAAFEAHPGAGVLSVGGKMVDRPHLTQARRVLERVGRE